MRSWFSWGLVVISISSQPSSRLSMTLALLTLTALKSTYPASSISSSETRSIFTGTWGKGRQLPLYVHCGYSFSLTRRIPMEDLPNDHDELNAYCIKLYQHKVLWSHDLLCTLITWPLVVVYSVVWSHDLLIVLFNHVTITWLVYHAGRGLRAFPPDGKIPWQGTTATPGEKMAASFHHSLLVSLCPHAASLCDGHDAVLEHSRLTATGSWSR